MANAKFTTQDGLVVGNLTISPNGDITTQGSIMVAGVPVSTGGGGAGDLIGSTLSANVTASSLTSVGTLTSLGVTGAVTAGSFSGPLTGNVTGNVSGSAATAPWTGISSKPTTLTGFGITDAVNTSTLGVAGGVATLDGSGLVPSAQLPSYVDDVVEYANLAGFPGTGEAGKIYVALDTNKTYRWSGSAYVFITSGAVDSVAGKTGVVTLVKADVGLGNVDNTSDLAKPISTLTQSALDGKQAAGTYATGGGTATGTNTGDQTNVSGSAATVTTAAQPAITSVGTLTSLGVTGDVSAGSFTGSVTALKTASGSVNVSASAAPSVGQVLKATSATTATWQSAGASFTSTDDTATDATYYPLSATSSGGSSAVTSSSKFTFNPSTGTLAATVLLSMSDATTKTNVQPLAGAGQILAQLNGVSFDWKDGTGSSYGFISQDVAPVLPHAVVESEGKMMLNYSAIIPFLVETVKQQQITIAELERKVGKLIDGE